MYADTCQRFPLVKEGQNNFLNLIEKKIIVQKRGYVVREGTTWYLLSHLRRLKSM